MILREFRCPSCHVEAEILQPNMAAVDPDCADCGTEMKRVFSRINLGGQASAGPSRMVMPQSWNGTGQGDKSLIDGWRTKAIEREKLEEKYPELAGDRRPVLAHEGKFAENPLRAGSSSI